MTGAVRCLREANTKAKTPRGRKEAEEAIKARRRRQGEAIITCYSCSHPSHDRLTAKPDGEGIMGYGATDYDDGYGWREREGEVGVGERERARKTESAKESAGGL